MSDRTRAEAQEADADGPGRPGGDEHAPPTSKWEWAVAALGAALVAGAIGYLVYHALTIGEGVPEVVVEHAGTRAVQGGHIVRFLARNRGSTTAASPDTKTARSSGSDQPPWCRRWVSRSDSTEKYCP